MVVLVALAAGAVACSSVPVETESALHHHPVTASPAHTTTTIAAQSDQLTDIAFFDPTTGYGLFDRQAQPTCQAVVGSTATGGADFGSLTVVTSWPCANAAPVSQLAFDDHGDGFLYRPDLFVTHDAGVTWTQVPQSGVVLSVEALGSSVWIVESSCPAPTDLSHPCPMRLLESADGGRTWSGVGVPIGASTVGLSAQTWLVRLSTSAAYLASNPSFSPENQTSTAPLWYTADSGRTWSTRRVDCGFNALADAISVAPDGTLVAVCADQPSAGAQPKSTVRSTDGGFTWHTMTPCPGGGALTFGCVTTGPLAAGYLGEIDAVTADAVYLLGGRSPLLVTHDGGVTWSAVGGATIGDTGGGGQNVIFFNPSDGVVLGDNGQTGATTIWSTSDGGATWDSVIPIG